MSPNPHAGGPIIDLVVAAEEYEDIIARGTFANGERIDATPETVELAAFLGTVAEQLRTELARRQAVECCPGGWVSLASWAAPAVCPVCSNTYTIKEPIRT